MVPERSAVYEAASFILSNRDAKALNYCVNYARELMDMCTDEGTSDNAITMQCRYVLNNMTHWRGDVAKSVRIELKRWIDAP